MGWFDIKGIKKNQKQESSVGGLRVKRAEWAKKTGAANKRKGGGEG